MVSNGIKRNLYGHETKSRNHRHGLGGRCAKKSKPCNKKEILTTAPNTEMQSQFRPRNEKEILSTVRKANMRKDCYHENPRYTKSEATVHHKKEA